MSDPKKESESSFDWSWDRFWKSPGMPFFFVGLTFVFIGISNVTFLIIGITFMAVAFAMGDEDGKDKRSDSARDFSSEENQSDDESEKRNP